jgi:hypothetical protein
MVFVYEGSWTAAAVAVATIVTNITFAEKPHAKDTTRVDRPEF